MAIRLMILCLLLTLVLPTIAFAQEERCRTDLDLLAEGQAAIDAGDYDAARSFYGCAIELDPTEVDAYRGRIEAALLAGEYTLALDDFNRFRLQPLQDAIDQIIADYHAALEADPDNINLLTSYSAALWWYGEHEMSIAVDEHILELDPENAYATLFHGSSSILNGDIEQGLADFDAALELDPENAASYFIIADAHTYGTGDLEQAIAAAQTAADMGLESARLDALLATAFMQQGDMETAAIYFVQHIQHATLEMLDGGGWLQAGQSIDLEMSPGITYYLSVPAQAGETVVITTNADPIEADTLIVLLASDGTPIMGNDDFTDMNAGLEYVVEEADTFTLYVATFNSAGTGEVTVTRE